MNEFYSYPENDYRNYLMHWGKGKESKKHKYVSRYMGKNKKWYYIYPEDLKNGAKNLLNKFTGKGNPEDISETEAAGAGQAETTKPSKGNSSLLSKFTELLGQPKASAKTNKQVKRNDLSSIKAKLSKSLQKPLSTNKPKKPLDSYINSLRKSKDKVSKAFTKSVNSFKSSKLPKQTATKERSSLAKTVSRKLGKAKSKLIGMSSQVNDTRPSGDASLDHSKSNKAELRSYLLSLGVHLATGNKVGLTKEVLRGIDAAKAAKRNKDVETVRSSAKIDDKTGLHLKTNKGASKLEDMAMVNPEYKNFDANTKNNCMLCTTAYDLRRRGYEVSAKKASYGYDAPDALRWYKDAKVEDVSMVTDMSSRARRQHARNTLQYINQQGEGARGNLMVYWATGGGHSMAYEIENGDVTIYDCQANKTYRGASAEKLLSNTLASQCIRLDNVEVDWKYVKEAVR